MPGLAVDQDLIEKTVAYVKQELQHAEKGHDWWHINRVWNNARHIASHENADMLVVELAALLHDIADAKFNGGDEEEAPRKTRSFLTSLGIPGDKIEKVVFIISNISFRKNQNRESEMTLELAIVQDADRLDAIGAIGIARAFHFGGYKNRPFYDPLIAPGTTSYKSGASPTINHFYEKLLLLKDLMNTDSGRRLAEKRHDFMLQFLEEFYEEWNGSPAS